ncbi:RluA family pseudouridine synthase [Granulosicoccus antarcticus]|uniref:Pseudouridine synthase n=1 Tax=Granulosicoccus antarcticus IMCC3135 TaxID=1192854 RepID=A0A2Z2NM67_9GAMM|nr:RluA family pseudouridine synthase [Granulosicoccus antarcticus]ASJ72436.1 Ribosomal large subunit pseudouridine synthase C [Granulosicoccus antarcticus IMCC3135]
MTEDKQTDASAQFPLSKSRHESVTEDEDGQRIDNFLIKRCGGVPRSHLYQLIRKGDVRVDGKRIKQTRKLVAGEKVRIPPIRLQVSEVVKVPDKLARAAGRAVIFDHPDFLVVNKPPGIAVHGGSGLAFGFIDALRQQLDQPKLELAHRLDRATSGCLLIGRSLKANRKLQNLFRQRTVTKRYLALVDGVWPAGVELVDAPLLKNVEHAGERRVTVDSTGQHALTYFRERQRFSQATLMDVELDTGRTHQIRVHAKHMGHAVVGDERYGDNNRNTRFRQSGLDRLYLHSSELAFDWGAEHIHVTAPVDAAWEKALVSLESAIRR